MKLERTLNQASNPVTEQASPTDVEQTSSSTKVKVIFETKDINDMVFMTFPNEEWICDSCNTFVARFHSKKCRLCFKCMNIVTDGSKEALLRFGLEQYVQFPPEMCERMRDSCTRPSSNF